MKQVEEENNAGSGMSKEPFLCPGCDLLLSDVVPTPHKSVCCPRCGKRLARWKHNSVENSLCLSLTALVLFIPANFMDLLDLNIVGLKSSSSLFSASLSMFARQELFAGFVVLLCGVLFPFSLLIIQSSVSLGLWLGWRKKWMVSLFRTYHYLREWAMADVYLIALLVTMIKISKMASLDFDIGFFSFVAMVVFMVAAISSVDTHLFWHSLEEKGDKIKLPVGKFFTGVSAGLWLCPVCEKVVPAPEQNQSYQVCDRCHGKVYKRKKESFSRALALILVAAIFFVPANILPIMEVEQFGSLEKSTIFDGIVYFFREGSYGIGIIILTASILVPCFKIYGMSIILWTVKSAYPAWLRHKTIMFRFIEFVGRWSMLDIFVIALLCALIRFNFWSVVNVEAATFYFTGVVVATMLATISFDTRLLWDLDNPVIMGVKDATT